MKLLYALSVGARRFSSVKKAQSIAPIVATTTHSPRKDIYRWNSSEPKACRHNFPAVDSLPDDIKKIIEEVEEKAGFIPNVFRMLSRRPEEFRAFFMTHDSLMAKESGNLTQADREMIVVATSAANNCLYCVVAHGALLRIYSKNPFLADQIATNWETADIDNRQRAILTFAMKICHAKEVTQEDYDVLAKHGLDEEDATDIGSIAAFFAMSNRLATLAELKPNKEFYMLGRLPRKK